MTNGQAADYLLTLPEVDRVIMQRDNLVMVLEFRGIRVEHAVNTGPMRLAVVGDRDYLHAEYCEAVDRMQAHIEGRDP